MERRSMQLKVKKLWRQSRGDTIVEVLIAIAVLSFVLSISYSLANKSSIAVRQSQERGEAFKITTSQLENFKQFISTPNPANVIPPTNSVFCIKPDGTLDVFTAPLPPDNAQAENFTAFATHPSCKTGELYYRYIKRVSDSTYEAHTRWNRANGSGIDEATMVYRVYPDRVTLLDANPFVAATCPAIGGVDYGDNMIGGCDPCPTGFDNPDGNGPCNAIPAKQLVYAHRVANGPGNTTPASPCSSTTYSPLGGANINLGSESGNTSLPDSSVLFDDLAFNTAYSAVMTVPAGNNPSDAQVAGPKYTACPPTTKTFTSCSTPASCFTNPVQVTEFKFYANCYQHYVDVTAPYEHFGPYYNVEGWIPQSHTIYWDSHPGSNNGYVDGRRLSPYPALQAGYYWKISDTITTLTAAGYYMEIWLTNGNSGVVNDPPIWGVVGQDRASYGIYADQELQNACPA